MKKIALHIESQYFGPISSWSALIRSSYVDFCESEDWVKSSFRNRCIIPAANGLVHLSVPVSGGRSQKASFRDIRIDNKSAWKQIHWRTIFSAYGKSPWFIYYKEGLEALFQTRQDFLVDWNRECFSWIADQLKADIQIDPLARQAGDDILKIDLKDRVNPSNYLQVPGLAVYTQTFQDRLGFKRNVSILDLICCEGKGARSLLMKNLPGL